MLQTDVELRKPDFLVIGAMKCGTTTLYHDLLAQPSIFLPDKESNFLLRESFEGGFEKARADQVCGEVCPDYAKLPQIVDVADKAMLFRPKIIYLVRHPLNRLISHHHYISSLRAPQNPGMSPNIEEAIERFPELIDYSRYAFQLRPWIESFGRDSILIIRFEDYIAERESTLQTVCEFIGADFSEGKVDGTVIHNPSLTRPVLTPFWKTIRENRLYRAVLRPFTSLEVRNRIRQLILPKAKGRPDPPLPETREQLTEIFRKDLESLKDLLGAAEPLWELES